MEILNQESKKIEPVIEPLTAEEKLEFDGLIEKIKSDSGFGPQKHKYEWQIVERFGERAVPHFLALPDANNFLSQVGVHRFLNTLVTEKTAPLVLKGMQEGAVDFWIGALAAAEGKTKTAEGLADLLFKIKWPNSSERSHQIVLLEAISMCGVDAVSPKIVEFYKKLRSDEGYAKDHGNKFYGLDAEDTAGALARLNGPISKKLLEDLVQNGDEYIQPAARDALDGKLYIGHPIKFLIKNPAEKILKSESTS